MARDERPQNAGFIGRVVEDPSNPPQTRMLSGWLGDSAEEKHRRLYTDPALSSYVDIPEEAILHSEPIRDVQPEGGVYVWVKRDAAVKQGGSASARAGQFLEGPVARDFSSPDKVGLRCVTQVPCGEPTGFTGQCTKQPDMGGGWPCITALPLCSAEPTGFTGKCTHQPWPNPTQYFGCTFFHCPTNDLTHQPWLCNIICGPEPKQPAAKEGDEAAGGEPGAGGEAVTVPGCGYTKWWGLCDTQYIRCQPSVQNPCIPQTEMPPCGMVAEGVDAGGGNPNRIAFTEPPCSAVDSCPTRIRGCQTAPPTQLCTPNPKFCPTVCGPECQTPQPHCTSINCTQAGPTCNTGVGFTLAPPCPNAMPEAMRVGGTQFGPQCPTPATMCFVCTNVPDICGGAQQEAAAAQVGGGGGGFGGGGAIGTIFGCPTRESFCTLFGPVCPTRDLPCPTREFACTIVGTQCFTRQLGCTQFGPQCPTKQAGCTQFGPQCPTKQLGCTQFGPQCPTRLSRICPSAIDACPTRICTIQQDEGVQGGGGGGAAVAQTAATVCTQYGPQCPTPATMCFICTNVPDLCGMQQNNIGVTGWYGCHPTLGFTCTQFGCPPR